MSGAFARFYEPFTSDSDTFEDVFVLATPEAVSYEYTKKWCGTGTFTMVLPARERFINKIFVNHIIYYNGDWLIITDKEYNEQSFTLKGTDLNGLLDNRITVFGETQVAGADGYDVVSGTTGECVNHYINNNIAEPTDENRRIPKLEIKSAATGIESDSYMARLEILSDVVIELCDNASIGYRISGDLTKGKFYFETLEGTDHSVNQSDNPYVIFSRKWGNIISASFTHSVNDLYNAIYATGADVTMTVYRDDEDIPSGFNRRETAIDVTVDSVSDIKQYALYDVQDNVETHAYDLDIKSTGLYGTKFELGDLVSVTDSVSYNTFTAQVTEVKTTLSQGQRKISVTLGKQNQKLLNKIIRGIYNGNLKKR